MTPSERERRTRAAAEAMEDAAIRLLGRDLGTIHRNHIAEYALDAAHKAVPVVSVEESERRHVERMAPAVEALADANGRAERAEAALREIAVTPCREWLDSNEGYIHCDAPAEFVLWGKLIKPEALGPRCYDHAADHVGHHALGDPSWAIVDLRPALRLLGSPSFSGEEGTDD